MAIDGKLLRKCKLGALQFVVIKPFLAGASVRSATWLRTRRNTSSGAPAAISEPEAALPPCTLRHRARKRPFAADTTRAYTCLV